MNFKEQAERYITEIQNRRRSPVRQATVRIYQSYLDSHILPFFKNWDLLQIENGGAKQFVTQLNRSGLAPATVNAIFNVVKAVLASAVDQNGNEMYPRKWNPDFIDLPVVSKTDQDAPIVTPEQVNAAVLAADRQLQAMLVLLAASGLRIGELLALQGHQTTSYDPGVPGTGFKPYQITLKGAYGFSYWDPETGVVHVKSTLVRGKVEPQAKTGAGTRQIDLHPDVNDFLKRSKLPAEGFLFHNSVGKRARIETLYDQLEDLGLDTGFHAFRRFRATHLESMSVPRSLTSFWLGHAGQTITDRYIKIGQDFETRRDWASRAGYGFTLPEAK
jgi:integrase